jgi:hypothetical protein
MQPFHLRMGMHNFYEWCTDLYTSEILFGVCFHNTTQSCHKATFTWFHHRMCSRQWIVSSNVDMIMVHLICLSCRRFWSYFLRSTLLDSFVHGLGYRSMLFQCLHWEDPIYLRVVMSLVFSLASTQRWPTPGGGENVFCMLAQFWGFSSFPKRSTLVDFCGEHIKKRCARKKRVVQR